MGRQRHGGKPAKCVDYIEGLFGAPFSLVQVASGNQPLRLGVVVALLDGRFCTETAYRGDVADHFGQQATPTVFSVGDLWLVDAALGYQFTKQLGLKLNANNLFDKKPKKLVDGSSSLWPFQSYSYVMNGPVNAAGGFYSATLTYNW